jgi:hypothetical protein
MLGSDVHDGLLTEDSFHLLLIPQPHNDRI